MALKVDADALRIYAAKLTEALAQVEAAESYVNTNGNFSANESGLIGYIIPHHRTYLDALNRMLTHLASIADASGNNMQQMAASYERTDKRSAEAIDASYPEVARTPAGTW